MFPVTKHFPLVNQLGIPPSFKPSSHWGYPHSGTPTWSPSSQDMGFEPQIKQILDEVHRIIEKMSPWENMV